jgi:hypothetical protein
MASERREVYTNLVRVSPEMIRAGIEELRELSGEVDLGYIVESICMAMEYQRLELLGQL